MKRPIRFPPAIKALLLQLSAFALTLLSLHILVLKPTPTAFAFTCGLIAACLSSIAKQARWWLIIQFLFAPTLVAALAVNLHPKYYLIAFLIFLLVFWNTYRTQVPLYLSSNKIWCALECYLPDAVPGKNFSFIDIGSGLGGVLTHLAIIRPDGSYCGVESAPLPFLWSWLRIRLGGYYQCRVLWGNLWECNLGRYDVVFAYLSPAPMERLWLKAQAEMRPGSVFISSTFCVPGRSPVETVVVDDLHHSTLLVWRL
ncbi:MAG: class I SAM-dependent methyltransferase [Methylococcaceae bacterium]|nr:class I SAM-dependent methyltransferase [Methylococcaceae bacterium]